MYTSDYLSNKLQKCPTGADYLIYEGHGASVQLWSALKFHTQSCADCKEVLREYEFLSGAHVLLKKNFELREQPR